jgi:hypothetical protein
LLIRASEKLLDEGRLESKQHAHLLKGKGQQNYRERGHGYNSEKYHRVYHDEDCVDQTDKKKYDD